MEFRRSGQRDERRRRVLRDEVLAGDTGQVAEANRIKSEVGPGTRTYSDAALACHQPPLTALLPKRVLTLVLWVLIASIAVAGVELLYSRCYAHLPSESRVSFAALDVMARGSLASWLSSATLILGGLVSLLVYSIRRHRIDDYRGRYRVWLWAAAGFILASLDATTGFHVTLASALGSTVGTAWLGNGFVWTVAVLSVMFGFLYVRMMFEVLTSRWSTAFLVSAGGLYLTAAAYLSPSADVTSLVRSTIIGSSALLSAHLCLVFAATLFGRHVYLEAQGELPTPRRTSRKVQSESDADEAEPGPSESPRRQTAAAAPAAAPASTAASASGKQIRLDASHEKPPAKVEVQPAPKSVGKIEPKVEAKPATTKVQAPVSTPEFDEDDEDDDSPVNDANGRPLSKAERRRLRKLERRQKQRE